MSVLTQRQLFFQHLAQTSAFPLALEIERAEGVYLYDTESKPYLDFISGIAVSNVGHRHPAVVGAIQAQLEKYMHLMVYGEYVQTPQVQLAEALVGTLRLPDLAFTSPFGAIDAVYFTNSGTEAVEGAMKLAKRFTGRTGFVSCRNAYHGATQGALSLAGAEFFKQNFRPLLPDCRLIEHGKVEDLDQITTQTAAVVIEIVAGEAGVRLPSAGYFSALRSRCTEVGALLIVDEIQSGFGRTGTFWAFEQVGVYPDVLLAAKGMGGGMPIGAFMASQQLMRVFQADPILGHITTFGGHPVSCAASLACLRVIMEEQLTLNAQAQGQFLKEHLKHPLIQELRGVGLMMAAQMENFTILKAVIDRCIQKGLITDWFLFCDDAMRIAPPLLITQKEVEQGISILLDALDEQLNA
jgi:acetylornithine/succinyldiaminopimelate/putrescine aminotransferase